MAPDERVIVAVAALAGSFVGACSSVAVTFIGQRLQARWAQLRTELEERERLYGAFVEESVRAFASHRLTRSYMRQRRWANGCWKLMNGRRRIQRKFSRDTP